MFSINDLLVEFPGRVLFDRIGFVVNSRDRIGLVGRNGAGKSTLLKILAGLDSGYSGHLGFPKDKTVGYLVQERSFTSAKTVMAEAETAFEAVHKLMAESERLTKELTERTDYESNSYLALSEKLHEITERLHLNGGSNYQEEIEKVLKGLGFVREEMFRPMAEFSGGWQMRVELAKLLLKRPDLLLLDEPTAHLDLQYQVSLLELVSELAHKDNLAVLVALHDLNLAAHYADRIALMVAGNIKAMGKPKEVLKPELIAEAYCLPVQVVSHPFLDIPLVLPDIEK